MFLSGSFPFSVVEQSDSREDHGHAILIAALNDRVIADGAARLCYIVNAGSAGPLDIVREGEESIGAQSHAAEL